MNKLLLLTLFCGSLYAFSAQATIIFLNGTSSAGKSSITRELQSILGRSFVVVSTDTFLMDALVEEAYSRGLLKRSDPKPRTAKEIKKLINALPKKQASVMYGDFKQIVIANNHAMYAHVAHLACQGWHVIIDHVMTFDDDIKDCLQTLGAFDVFFVLAHCPLGELVRRVYQRNSSQDKAEKRTLDSVLGHYAQVHCPGSKDDFLEIISYEQMSYYIDLVRSSFPTVKLFSEFKEFVIRYLELDQCKYVYLCPSLAYDYVINTGNKNPHTCAQSIAQALHKAGGNYSAFAENKLCCI